MDTLELRREPRFAVNDPVHLTVVGLNGYPRLQGRVSSVSRSGVAVTIPSRIPAGTAAIIEMSGLVLSGQIRYSKKSADGYRTGVSIETVTVAGDDPKPAQPRSKPESLWGTLKRLDTAVKSHK